MSDLAVKAMRRGKGAVRILAELPEAIATAEQHAKRSPGVLFIYTG